MCIYLYGDVFRCVSTRGQHTMRWDEIGATNRSGSSACMMTKRSTSHHNTTCICVTVTASGMVYGYDGDVT